jgi:hypothetical protein
MATITQDGLAPITQTFTDQVAPDASPTVGVLTITSNTIALPGGGQLVVNESQSTSNAISQTNPPVGADAGLVHNPPPSLLVSQAFSISNNSPLPVMIDVKISDINFNSVGNPVLPGRAPFTFQASGAGNFNVIPGGGAANVNGSTATINAFASTTNTLFATTGAGVTQVESSGLLTVPTGLQNSGYSNSGPFVSINSAGPFSETVEQIINLPAGVQLTGRLNSETDTSGSIPEIDPGSAVSALACLGSGVLMLAGGRRRRARA